MPGFTGRLSDKVIIVTGGAQGLGEALCERFIREGAFVVVADINIAQAEATAQKLCGAAPGKAAGFQCDVTDYEKCEQMAEFAVQTFGKIDCLVANAAILIAKPIGEMSASEFRKVVDVNLTGYFNACKSVIVHMRKNGGGAICQINSKSGKKGSAKNCAYSASKFGGVGLTQSLSLELAEENIRVNSICPGNLLDSPLWVNSLYEQYAKNQNTTKEVIRQKYIDQVPMKRGCTYDDVANAAVFLLSGESSYMTGQAINVTGGQQMQ